MAQISRRELLAAAVSAALYALLGGLRLAPRQPRIIPREEWGARRPNPFAPAEFGISFDPRNPAWYLYLGDLRDIYRTVAIHHTAHYPGVQQTVQDVQNLHMDRNRWADIGYHYVIATDGATYAGRDVRVRGASVAGYNTGTIGVALIGNFERERPTEAQLESLTMLVRWLAYRYRLTHLAGHQEFNPETDCPGTHLARHLDALAEGARLARGTQGYQPPV